MKISQKNRILAFLLNGNTLTPLEALTKFGSFRLAARINELRNEGFIIDSKSIETINGSIVSQYELIGINSK